jgi:hypothetical protein
VLIKEINWPVARRGTRYMSDFLVIYIGMLSLRELVLVDGCDIATPILLELGWWPRYAYRSCLDPGGW